MEGESFQESEGAIPGEGCSRTLFSNKLNSSIKFLLLCSRGYILLTIGIKSDILSMTKLYLKGYICQVLFFPQGGPNGC